VNECLDLEVFWLSIFKRSQDILYAGDLIVLITGLMVSSSDCLWVFTSPLNVAILEALVLYWIIIACGILRLWQMFLQTLLILSSTLETSTNDNRLYMAESDKCDSTARPYSVVTDAEVSPFVTGKNRQGASLKVSESSPFHLGYVSRDSLYTKL